MQTFSSGCCREPQGDCKAFRNNEKLKGSLAHRHSETPYQSARCSDTIGQDAIYKAHMRESKVPVPIALIETDEQTKISWIEQRIREIYTAYGKTLPSIAIFLNGKDRVSAFAQALQDTDFFYDNGINVIDGSLGTTLGNRNQVRVFPIDKVKGMEFDAVFFVDINNAKGNEEIIKCYLYVGVSRAAFFLGVTLTEDVPTLTKYFKIGEDWKEIAKTENN